MFLNNLHGLQVTVISVGVRVVVSAISVRSGLHHGRGRRVLPVHHVAHPGRVGARVSAGACKIGPWVDHNPDAASGINTVYGKEKGRKEKKMIG